MDKRKSTKGQKTIYKTCNETSADEQEDKENIGKIEQVKIKAKTDKDGTDHHDHGSPKLGKIVTLFHPPSTTKQN
jgi:hypothetical protein